MPPLTPGSSRGSLRPARASFEAWGTQPPKRPQSAGPSRRREPTAGTVDAPGGWQSLEWASATQRLIGTAANGRAVSGAVRADTRAVRQRSYKEAVHYDRSVKEALHKKLEQTAMMQRRLRRAIDSLCDEAGTLQRLRGKVVEALNARQGPLDVVRRRLKVRRRKGGEREDEAQAALRSEEADLAGCVRQLAQDVEQADRLLGEMVSAQDVLEADLADKSRALALDSDCLQLPAKASGAGSALKDRLSTAVSMADSFMGSTSADLRAITSHSGKHHMVEWREATHTNTRAASELVAASKALREVSKVHIKGARESNERHHKKVHRALMDRMRFNAALHGKLTEQIQCVDGELVVLERDRQKAESALRAKELPLRQCVERLSIRRHRPDRESATDQVERELKDQLTVIANAVKRLESAHDAISSKQQQLRETRSELERDRSAKVSALDIDKKAYHTVLSTCNSSATVQPNQDLLRQAFGA
eukprot:Hpha_TRINITY_DN8565_c0_g1::TRINITY_DN8565_c0_g1_i1::g.146451::m.146451